MRIFQMSWLFLSLLILFSLAIQLCFVGFVVLGFKVESSPETERFQSHPESHAIGTESLEANGKAVVRLGSGFGFAKSAGSGPKPLAIQLAAGFFMAMKDLNESYSDMNVVFKMSMGDTRSTFTEAIKAAMYINLNSFGGLGVHAYVGNNQSFTTEGADYIFQDTDTGHVGYGANDTALSHNAVYPAFIRVFPSTAYEGHVLADICYSQFGWRRVVVVYSTDSYGVDAYAEFAHYASQADMTILDAKAVTADTAVDFSGWFSTLHHWDPRIFVLLISSTTQARQFMADGYESGILGGKSVVLGMSPLFAWSQFLSTSSPVNMTATDKSAQRALTSVTYLGLQVASSDWRATTRGKAWMSRYLSQPDTVVSLGGGKYSCLNTTDDDGSFYLYKSCSKPTKCVCTGQQFSKYKADGSNVDAMYLIPYVYDATFALAYGVLNYSAALSGSGPLKVPSRISGRALKTTIVQNVSFDGVTGRVAFSAGRSCMVNFGRGDRSAGIRYALTNLQFSTSQWTSPSLSSDSGSSSTTYTVYGFSLRRVGTWASEGGYTACEDDSLLADSGTTNFTGGCHGPVWYAGVPSVTGVTEAPSDRAPPVVLSMPEGMRGALAALGSLQLLAVTAVSGSLVWYRKTRLVKASQPALMWLVLLAGVLGAARVLLFQSPVSDGACVAGYWTGHLTFLLGVSALLVKTLRVHLVVNARSMRRVKFTTRKALLLLSAIVLCVSVYMAIANGFSPPRKGAARRVEETGQEVSSYHCRVSIRELDTVLFAFEALLLAVSGKLCYDTKNVPDAVNETTSIVIGKY